MNIHTTIDGKPRKRITFQWTEEKIAIAAKMWREGFTSTAIASRMGVSRGSVTSIASAHRDRFPGRTGKGQKTSNGMRVSVSPEWLRKAAALWADGKSANKIAAMTGVKSSTAYHRIKAHPELFPDQCAAPSVIRSSEPRSYIGNGRWVDRVPRHHISGEVHSMPRVSILNGKEG